MYSAVNIQDSSSPNLPSQPAPRYLSLTELNAALAVRDLSDPAQGSHAMQLILDGVVGALKDAWDVPAQLHRHNPLVATRDNYDRLGYSPGAATV